MHIQFAEIPVENQGRAQRFYTEHLGCTVAADAPMGPDGWRWIELSFPGSPTNLHLIHRPPHWSADEPVLVLVDADVHGTIEKLRTARVEIITEPAEMPWQPGRIVAEFRDSEGNRMVLGS